MKETYGHTMLAMILHQENLYLELLPRNDDPDKYSYSGCGIAFDTC